MVKIVKTNVMRILTQQNIHYGVHQYLGDDVHNGVEVAEKMGVPVASMFKTLVTQGKSGQYYVFMISVEDELDLKKAAQAVNEKSVAMIKEKELLPLTGYVHGGCSPIGMKKPLPTTIDDSAKQFKTILFSAGKRGYSVELSPMDLAAVLPLKIENLVSKRSTDEFEVEVKER